MNNSLACRYISTGRLQNNVSFNNSENFSYEKMHKTLLRGGGGGGGVDILKMFSDFYIS